MYVRVLGLFYVCVFEHLKIFLTSLVRINCNSVSLNEFKTVNKTHPPSLIQSTI